MYHNAKFTIHAQRGNMVVMASFLIVVIGLLAAAMIKVISASSSASIIQVYGVRAELSAQTGIQEMLQISFPPDGSLADCNSSIASSASFSNVDGLLNCSYQASCRRETVNYGGQDFYSYKFQSTGSCEIDKQVVSRTISVDSFLEIN